LSPPFAAFPSGRLDVQGPTLVRSALPSQWHPGSRSPIVGIPEPQHEASRPASDGSHRKSRPPI
jgi:hypothetical protein